MTSTSLLTISMPNQVKSSSFNSSLKEHARHVPFGIANAFLPLSIRIPDGPSSQHSVGTPMAFSSFVIPPYAAAVPVVTFGLPMPSPRMMSERSSSESCAMNSSSVFFPFFTSASLIPRSPVCSISFGRRSILVSRWFTLRSGTGS